MSKLSQTITRETPIGEISYYDLQQIEKQGSGKLDRLPYSIRVLLESLVRKFDDKLIKEEDIIHLSNWQPIVEERKMMPFYPGRVVMQDLSGVPVLVDLAAMRSAAQKMGLDPSSINPVLPVDVIIDHSLQVDVAGQADALQINMNREYERNHERFAMVKWGQNTFQNFRVFPPGRGIIHQINLETLANGLLIQDVDGKKLAFPETLVGTDSHTTMINGLGVLGWGVGGIEAVAAMMGEPLEIPIPDVVGVELSGAMQEGVTPTDVTLWLVSELRKIGVVGKFVEVFGEGLSSLSLADRAMMANMTPETGATVTFFPVDAESLRYLKATGRDEAMVDTLEMMLKDQNLFWTDDAATPTYSHVLKLNLSSIKPAVAGPRRPQDWIDIGALKPALQSAYTKPLSDGGFNVPSEALDVQVPVTVKGQKVNLTHGSLVIASITSCTNTSNPFVILSAAMLAKKAAELGLKVSPAIKTSFTPGSRIVTAYLQASGLLPYLEQLGFHIAGYACASCIGNTGPLDEAIVKAIKENGLVASSVVSGNRNFEGRISPDTQANYLASPPLVIAYALAGRMDINLTTEPLGATADGSPVYLKDVWPSNAEVTALIEKYVRKEMFQEEYYGDEKLSEEWKAIPVEKSEIPVWNEKSTYLQEPPFFEELFGNIKVDKTQIKDARILGVFADSITTDHISPAGSIMPNSPAGLYLKENGVKLRDFNTYGSRRGNDRVMVRGTFANVRLKNQMVPGVEGGYTMLLPDEKQMTIYDAAMIYRERNQPLVVLAGKEYGTGSSRDWAAKGAGLLGVRVVIAESYERIHRSNLAGMGILPLQFINGESVQSLGLTGHETITIEGIDKKLIPGNIITVKGTTPDGKTIVFDTKSRLDNLGEVDYYLNGGILPTILLDAKKDQS
ncbi:MAG: aconitate hydratase AcnA [Anaerolineaceae bacterium]|nr:aconitate hydratase AcnA [Anaerolineaceae bacterium]